MWLGDFPEDFTTVICMFTTHSTDGAPVAPSSAFEAADVLIYKDGSATQKATTNGVTMTSPFDSLTGLHCLSLDTSNDTGDTGFWEAGHVYTLVLSPDETVDSLTARKVIGQFTLNITAASIASILADTNELQTDWANGGRLDLILDARASQASVDTVDGIVDAILVDTAEIGAAGAGLTALATQASVNTIDDLLDTEIAAIKAKTDNLPADPADASDIAALIDALPTANENADALLDRTDGVETGLTLRNAMRLNTAVLAGKVSGARSGSEVFRNAVADSKNRLTVTSDNSGNRTAITTDLT